MTWNFILERTGTAILVSLDDKPEKSSWNNPIVAVIFNFIELLTNCENIQNRQASRQLR
jgi:hypothetical protein